MKRKDNELLETVKALLEMRADIYDCNSNEGEFGIETWQSPKLSEIFDRLENAVQKAERKK